MNTINLVKSKLFTYIDLSYFIKFFLLFLCLFNFNRFFVGITQPGNIYFPFLDQYLNYVAWIESSIIHTSNILAHAIGINSQMAPPFILMDADGVGVTMSWGCSGVGVMSFWFAFVVCDRLPFKKKMTWMVAGLLAIFFTNCLRVTLILSALHFKWDQFKNMDHHQFFNNLSYGVLMLMILLYTRKNNVTASTGQ